MGRRQERGRGRRSGTGVQVLLHTDPNPQDRTESRQGRTTPVLGRAQLLVQTQGTLCTGRCAAGMGPCPVWELRTSQSSRAVGPIVGKHRPAALLQAGTGVQQCPAPGTRPAGDICGSYRTAPSFRPSLLLREKPASHPSSHPTSQPSILPSCPVPGLKKCPCKGTAEGQQWCGRSVVPQPESALGSAWGPAAWLRRLNLKCFFLSPFCMGC